MNGARGTIVGFKWSKNARHQSMPGELPTEVYVRFLDPNVGKLSKVPVVSEQQDVVPIQPISACFYGNCLLYTSPSPRDRQKSRMPSSA